MSTSIHLSQRQRRSITAVLLLLGAALFWRAIVVEIVRLPHHVPSRLAALVCLLIIWPLRYRAANWLARGDEFLRGRRPLVAAMVFFATLGFFLFMVHRYAGEMYLKIHDEHSYMIQARQMAHFHLWHAPYPPDVAPSFDTFYFLNQPKYASEYFPGTALLVVPLIWLGLPYWWMPVLLASVSVMLLYLCTAHLLSDVFGIVAAAMIVPLHLFVMSSLSLLSETPNLALELLAIWAYLNWWNDRRLRWTTLIGAAMGLDYIVRPLDALCLAAPLGFAVLYELRGNRARVLRTAALAVLAGAPMVALQVIDNVGITGNALVSPKAYQVGREYPAPFFGFTAHPSYVPQPTPNEARYAWRQWIDNYYNDHTVLRTLHSWFHDHWRQMTRIAIPLPAMAILFLPGLLSVNTAPRAVMLIWLILYLGGYTLLAFWIDPYWVAAMPAIIWIVLLGCESIRRAWPRQAAYLLPVLVLLLLGISLQKLPLFHRGNGFDPNDYHFIEQKLANETLALLPRRPALVLFKYDLNSSRFPDEPVYNDQTAFPDQAMIVRARDLGPVQNMNLFRYYAEHQPDREVYVYDRRAALAGLNPLSPPLGTAAQLAAAGLSATR